MTIILGIETSCDDTAAAIVKNGDTIVSNVVASQLSLHAKFGGIFPEMASRAHIESIFVTVKKAVNESNLTLDKIDAIAVTQGPGLAGSLVVGMNVAKGLALGINKKLIAVNHLEGHIHSLWLNRVQKVTSLQEYDDNTPKFPVIVLIVSGGHTSLVVMRKHGEYEVIGQTIDDAAGEAFDKVGRLLGLPYPGGPSIQEASKHGDPHAYDMPRAWLKDEKGETTFDFSFSGLKTAVLRKLQDIDPYYEPDKQLNPKISVNNIAASFQAAVIDVLVTKTLKAAEVFNAEEIHIAGGVSANASLRDEIRKLAKVPVKIPPLHLCTDNAVMIASAGHYKFLRGEFSDLDCDIHPNLSLHG